MHDIKDVTDEELSYLVKKAARDGFAEPYADATEAFCCTACSWHGYGGGAVPEYQSGAYYAKWCPLCGAEIERKS